MDDEQTMRDIELGRALANYIEATLPSIDDDDVTLVVEQTMENLRYVIGYQDV